MSTTLTSSHSIHSSLYRERQLVVGKQLTRDVRARLININEHFKITAERRDIRAFATRTSAYVPEDGRPVPPRVAAADNHIPEFGSLSAASDFFYRNNITLKPEQLSALLQQASELRTGQNNSKNTRSTKPRSGQHGPSQHGGMTGESKPPSDFLRDLVHSTVSAIVAMPPESVVVVLESLASLEWEDADHISQV